MPDGSEKPIAFGSRTLHASERNYSQLDKDAFSIKFAVRKFHQFLTGRQFKIITDHHPLVGVFNPSKPITQLMSLRLVRWYLLLGSYQYTIEYIPRMDHANTDGLSRLPRTVPKKFVQEPEEVLFLQDEVIVELILQKPVSRIRH